MPYVGREANSFTTVVDVTVSDDLTVTDDATIGGALSAKGGAVFNEDSADVDFRVESNGNANMLFVDGGNDRVGVGTNAPVGTFVAQATVPKIQVNNGSKHMEFGVGGSGCGLVMTDGHFMTFNHQPFANRGTDTNLTERMRIDANGAVTKPLQPAFQVSYSAGGISNLTTNQFNTLTFSAETFDIGSNNDRTTFTAPVTGKYMFAISLTFLNLDKDHSNWEMVLVTSNRNYQTSNTFDDWLEVDAGAITGHLTVLADMDASDTAFIKIAPTGGASQTDIHSTSYWSGYLAC